MEPRRWSGSYLLSVFKHKILSPGWSRLLLVLVLLPTVFVSGSRGQVYTGLPARGVEENGRVYIGEPASIFIGHLAMLMVTGKHPTIGNGTMQDTVNWVNDPLHSFVADGTGGLAIYAHPDVASRVLLLNGLTGMEVFHQNTLPSAPPLRDQMWDTVLTTLYSQGKPLIWGFAADDTHVTGIPGFSQSWNVALLPSVDLFALKNALRNGAFYITNGPDISGVSLTGSTITLNLPQSSEVLWLRAGQYHNGTTFSETTTLGAGRSIKIESAVTTSSLDIASLGVPLSDIRFVRAIVRTASNTYALTQPFKISATGDVSNPYPASGTWVKGQSHNHTDALIDNLTEISNYRKNYQSIGQLASFETAYSYWEVPYQWLDSDGVPDLTSVTPNKAGFGLLPQITIKGVNFVDGARVQLGPHQLTDVIKESANVLRATVPSNVPPGVYDVVVTNPDNLRGNLALSFTIQDAGANNERWASYNAPNLPWNQTISIMANGDEIWVGTMRGAARYSNGLWSQFIPGSGASRGIYGMAADPGGGLWFSSVGMWFRNVAGTFPWQWRSVNGPGGSDRWGKIAFDQTGTMWVTSRWAEGLAKRSPAGVWSVVNTGLPTVDNQAIACDQQGNVWVGFSLGIWKWDGSQWQQVAIPKSLPNAVFASVLATGRNGDMWAAVHPRTTSYNPQNAGIIHYKSDGTTEVFKAPQIPHPRVTDILATRNGDLWFASRAGVSRLDTRGQWQKFTTQNSGLVSDIVMGLAEDQAGNVWFATANGVSSFSPFDFAISNSGDVTASQGDAGTTVITTTLIANPSREISFSVSGLPPDTNATFSQAGCSPSCSSTLTINTSSSTTPGTYPITVTGDSTSLARSTALNLIVNAINHAPVTTDDSYNTDKDMALTVVAPGVLENDSDVDSDSLTAGLVTGPAHGTLTLNPDGSFTYAPSASYSGPDSFTYKANDGKVDSNAATVAITVNAVNHAPVAVNDSYNTNEDTTLTIAAAGVLGNDTDMDGDALTTQLVSGPSHGSLSLNTDGSFSYTPSPNYHGPDSYSYKVNDGTADSNPATVSITVDPVNDPSQAVNDSYNIDEDTALTVVAPGVLGNDSDVDTDSLTAGLVTGPAHGTLTLNPNGSFTYTPSASYSGPDSFTYKANDGKEDSNVATVAIAVNAVNHAPVAVNDSYNTNEDTTLSVVAPGVLGNDNDVDGNSLTASLVTGPANGSLTLNPNGSFTYTPTASYSGPDSFTYKANDGNVDSNLATVTITVNAVNHAPGAVNDNYNTNEDTTLSVVVPGVLGNDNDVDSDSLTAGLVTGPAHGTLTLNPNGSFTYTPSAGYSGPDSFTYKANDGNVDSNVATVAITVNAVNHAPVAVNDNYNTNEDTTLSVVAPGVLGNDSDVDGNSLAAGLVTGPAHGSLTLNPNGSFTYTPSANYNGPDNFTYKASDGFLASNTVLVAITVTAVNDAPLVTTPGTQNNSEGDTVIRPIQASDPEGDQISYSATGLPPGLSLDSATGIISGDISFGSAANSPYAVQVAVSDANAVNGTTTINFTWSIVNGILFRAASFAQNNGIGNTLVIAKPTGIMRGNVLLAAINVRGNPTIAAPAGWTLVSNTLNGTAMSQAIYVRLATATESNTYTWSFSSAQPAAGGIVAYGGVDRSSPVDVASGQANASSASITAPSISTTIANTRLVSLFGTAINAGISPPSGTTERGESAVSSGKDKIASEVADNIRGPIGPTGVRVATADKAAVNIGHQVALRPLAPPPTAPPDPPSNLTAAPGDHQISLSWNVSTAATSYNVKRLNTATNSFDTIQSGITATSYVDAGLTNGTTYTYVVTAVNSIGESANSNQAAATPCSFAATPGGLAATAGNAQVSLTWTAASGASGYNVKRSTTTGGPYNIIANISANSFSDTTVTNGTTYYYVVSAVNSCGESSNSSQVSAVPAGPSAPAAPGNLVASALSATEIRLTWTSNSTNEEGFKIERCVGTSCTNFVQISNPPLAAGITNYINTGLTPNTSYRYRVRAYNSLGDSRYSNISGAKTRPR